MIVVTERTALANALSRMSGIADRKQIVPILGNVMLTAAGDRLIIRAASLDMQVVDSIPAAVGAEGSTTVSADKLGELARGLPAGAQVGFKLGERLSVTSGRSKFGLGVLSPESFPQVWEDEWESSFDVDAAELADMIDAVSFAQSTDAAKVYLQGVLFEYRDGRFRVAASQGNMATYRDGPETPEFERITVPSKMVTEMRSIVTGAGATVRISLSDSKIKIQAGDLWLASKLIDKSLAFPDYMRVFPKDLPARAAINIEAFSGAIKRATIASQNSKDNTTKLTFNTGSLTITSQNSEADALDEIDIDYDGGVVKMALNPAHLLAILGHIDGDQVEMRFKDNKAAVTLNATGGDRSMSVIMPQMVAL